MFRVMLWAPEVLPGPHPLVDMEWGPGVNWETAHLAETSMGICNNCLEQELSLQPFD